MPIPFVIDKREHPLRDALNELLAQSARKPLDIAEAYFAISGYRLAGLTDAEAQGLEERLEEML